MTTQSSLFNHRILSHEEIVAIYQRIEHLEQQLRQPDTDRSELEKLIANEHEKVVRHNTRFVKKFARRYVNQGLDFEDLEAEGLIGLMDAAKRFDYTKGFTFLTYARWWVRSKITRAIVNTGKTVRIPVHQDKNVYKMKKLAREFEQIHGRQPREEEIKELLSVDITNPNLTMQAQRINDMVSMDAPVGTDGDATVGDFISDTDRLDYASQWETRNQALTRISILTEREQDVIKKRFGIDHDHPHTLEEIGQHMGVTRERIRQIECKAIKKLRGREKNRHSYPELYVEGHAEQWEDGNDSWGDDAPLFVIRKPLIRPPVSRPTTPQYQMPNILVPASLVPYVHAVDVSDDKEDFFTASYVSILEEVSHHNGLAPEMLSASSEALAMALFVDSDFPEDYFAVFREWYVEAELRFQDSLQGADIHLVSYNDELMGCMNGAAEFEQRDLEQRLYIALNQLEPLPRAVIMLRQVWNEKMAMASLS